MPSMFASSFTLFVKHFEDSTCLFASNFKFEKLLFSKSILISKSYFYEWHICIYAIYAEFAHVGLKYDKSFYEHFSLITKS